MQDNCRGNKTARQTVAAIVPSQPTASLAGLDCLCPDNAGQLGSPTPGFFYLGSGLLSSVLDNAPTYLSFFSALLGASGTHDVTTLLAAHPAGVLAVSLGSVFFGANTNFGNGPNFMVKAIADHQKVHTPTFLGYVVKFTLPFMVPMLLIIWLLFLRH